MDDAPRASAVDHLRSTGSYRHDALLYDDREQLVAAAVPFLLDGLAAGDAAVIATSARTASILREAVDSDPRVHVLDRGDVYRARTPTAITTFRELADERSAEGAQQVRVVAQRGADARAQAHRRGDRALERAVVEQQVLGGLLADALRAG